MEHDELRKSKGNKKPYIIQLKYKPSENSLTPGTDAQIQISFSKRYCFFSSSPFQTQLSTFLNLNSSLSFGSNFRAITFITAYRDFDTLGRKTLAETCALNYTRKLFRAEDMENV